MNGVQLIDAERTRQITEEKYSAEHDSQHGNQELAYAGACYALPIFTHVASYRHPENWPWDVEWWKPSYGYLSWGEVDDAEPDQIRKRIRDLVKAGALIAAEIDRLQRKVEAENGNPR